MTKPYAVYADRNGRIMEEPGMTALGGNGDNWVEMEELIPLPPGSDLFFLPHRRPVGKNIVTGKVELMAGKDRAAVAAGLPPGYTRLLLPAYRSLPGAPRLPFFGYTAVTAVNGRFFVAARKTDRAVGWEPETHNTPDLPALVEKKTAAYPENRILKQLAHCALVYRCVTAQNIFYGRGEGGLPVADSCNAQCLGCISLQPSECCPSPQQRIDFQPTVDEIVEVALMHLQAPGKTMISFGQGCEGEPLTAWRRLWPAVRTVRRRTGKGIININTNAGLTHALKELAEAGLDSARVSLLSAVAENYHKYHRPQNYTFQQVGKSVDLLRAYGVFVSINLLVIPGFTDRPTEKEALFAWLRRHPVDMIQLRNLNIDPGWFWKKMRLSKEPGTGISHFIDEIKKEFPGVLLGNVSRL